MVLHVTDDSNSVYKFMSLSAYGVFKVPTVNCPIRYTNLHSDYTFSSHFLIQGKQWMDRASRFRSSALRVGMKRPGIHLFELNLI